MCFLDYVPLLTTSRNSTWFCVCVCVCVCVCLYRRAGNWKYLLAITNLVLCATMVNHSCHSWNKQCVVKKRKSSQNIQGEDLSNQTLLKAHSPAGASAWPSVFWLKSPMHLMRAQKTSGSIQRVQAEESRICRFCYAPLMWKMHSISITFMCISLFGPGVRP